MIPEHLIIINPCPLTKPLGNIILNPRRCSTTTPNLASWWLGLVGFSRAKEWQLCFVECIFGRILGSRGVDEPQSNRHRRAKFDWSTRSKYSNIPQSTIGWLGFGWIGRGMERRLRFVAVKFRQKLEFGGGVSYI
jgi:hypothetical protein